MRRQAFKMVDCPIHGNAPTPTEVGCIWCYREKLERQVEELEGEVQSLASERDDLESQVASLEARLDELDELDALRDNIIDLEFERDGLQRDVSELQSEIDDLRNQAMDYEDAAYAEQRVVELEDEIAQQQEELRVLESVVQNGGVLADQLDEAQEEIVLLKTRLERRQRHYLTMVEMGKRRYGSTFMLDVMEKDVEPYPGP